MPQSLSRREFLKLSSLFLLSLKAPSLFAKPRPLVQNSELPNILIVIFDTLSASNMSLLGYQRNTSPNLARIADRAIVYHNHYAGGNWTYPSTASLLTGVYPWTHLAYRKGDPIISPYAENNLFSLFEDHYRIAYTHNPMAEEILEQLASAMDLYQPRQSLFVNKQLWLDQLFGKDFNIASLGWERIVKSTMDGLSSSLFLSHLNKFSRAEIFKSYNEHYPKGPPHIAQDNVFLLQDAIDWIQTQTLDLPQPYLAYFHLLPPHDPYSPHREYIGAFDEDGYNPIDKPLHFLRNRDSRSKSWVKDFRIAYDEFVLNLDSEFGRLYDFMEENGVLENTWVLFTSDHGEMFERGIRGHRQPTFHQPVIHVPLLILEPGNNSRRDIYSPTVAVDLLPTLLHLTGKSSHEPLDGRILPPFSIENLQADDKIFAVDAQQKEKTVKQPLSLSTTMLIKWPYKMTYYVGYKELPEGKHVFELFDLENDPEELNNLYSTNSSLSAELRDELLAKIEQKDQPNT